LNKPILVPQSDVTSLGSAIFAFLAAGTFKTVEDAQNALCPDYRTVAPNPIAATVYQELYELYRKLYFAFGRAGSEPLTAGDVLPVLRRVATQARTPCSSN